MSRHVAHTAALRKGEPANHALYVSKPINRVCNVVPVNFATVFPPWPSKTPKSAFPSSPTASFETVDPAGWTGISAGLVLDSFSESEAFEADLDDEAEVEGGMCK